MDKKFGPQALSTSSRVTLPSDPEWMTKLAARIDQEIFGRTFGAQKAEQPSASAKPSNSKDSPARS
jgi:hypothetical protein